MMAMTSRLPGGEVGGTSWSRPRRRPVRRVARALSFTTMILVWPALILMPGAALLLSWWLGVL